MEMWVITVFELLLLISMLFLLAIPKFFLILILVYYRLAEWPAFGEPWRLTPAPDALSNHVTVTAQNDDHRIVH